jgi:hypothetical protein
VPCGLDGDAPPAGLAGHPMLLRSGKHWGGGGARLAVGLRSGPHHPQPVARPSRAAAKRCSLRHQPFIGPTPPRPRSPLAPATTLPLTVSPSIRGQVSMLSPSQGSRSPAYQRSSPGSAALRARPLWPAWPRFARNLSAFARLDVPLAGRARRAGPAVRSGWRKPCEVFSSGWGGVARSISRHEPVHRMIIHNGA